MVDDNQDIKSFIMNWMNNSLQGPHSGVVVTPRKIQAVFYRLKMRQSMVEFVRMLSMSEMQSRFKCISLISAAIARSGICMGGNDHGLHRGIASLIGRKSLWW